MPEFFYRGATSLRPDDLGWLWEHIVLNELHAHVGRGSIRYWRTKHGSEVDFVLVRHGGPSYVVTADTPDGRAYERTYGPLSVTFVSAGDLAELTRER